MRCGAKTGNSKYLRVGAVRSRIDLRLLEGHTRIGGGVGVEVRAAAGARVGGRCQCRFRY